MLDDITIAGRYRVIRRIGAGGMAVVYLGHDLLLNREVAIKALHPQLAADVGFRARFDREANAAANFTHPNIIDIFDVGEENGTPFIVMEFVEDDTLKQVIDREGPFHPDDVASLLEQVGAALDYAHERGYVHRDVKPQNILVDARGQAKVVDFGIAKGLSDTHLTGVGDSLGTVHYISPEQASGLMPTPASDIYSLGVVAYEMLTQRLPFEAETPVGVALRHLNDAPRPPSRYLNHLPPEVDAIVLRSLAKDPTQRFQRAGTFAQAMSEWRTHDQAPAASRPWNDPRPIDNARRQPERQSAGPVVSHSPSAESARDHTDRHPSSRHDEGMGSSTWLVGSAVVAGLIALVVVGFELSQRVSNDDAGDDPTATSVVAVQAATLDDPIQQTGTTVTPTADDPTITAGAVPVPNLTGLTQSDAIAAANARGFRLSVAESVFSESVAPDLVAEQDPPAETTLSQGNVIYVKPSRGSARVDLALLALVGQSMEAARDQLIAHGIGANVEQVRSADVPEGNVVEHVPADTAQVGDTVILKISAGDKVHIPSEIVSRPVAQVEAELTEMDFEVNDNRGVSRTEVQALGFDLASDSIEDGDVVGVEGSGARLDAWVEPGTTVTLLYYESDIDSA